MASDGSKIGCGLKIYPPDMPPGAKARNATFFILMCLNIFFQCFYFLVANLATPIVWGMPFGMFFVVLLIILQFLVMLVFYWLESGENED